MGLINLNEFINKDIPSVNELNLNYSLTEDELKFIELLNKLDEKTIQKYLLNHISEKNLHSEYIQLISKIASDYTSKTNNFIIQMKQDVNALYTDELYGKRIFKDIDITKANWFWYARLLRDTEENTFPNRNFIKPDYLLKRLKDILQKFSVDEIISFDRETTQLYVFTMKLIKKMESENGEDLVGGYVDDIGEYDSDDEEDDDLLHSEIESKLNILKNKIQELKNNKK